MKKSRPSLFEAIFEANVVKSFPFWVVWAVSVAWNFLQWEPLGVPPAVTWLLWAPYIVFLLAAIYSAVCQQLRLKRTLAGGIRFTLAWLPQKFLGILIVLLAASLLNALPVEVGTDVRLAIILASGGVGFVFGSLLLGWPVAQSLSSSFVSPLRLVGETKGYRWPLIGVNLAVLSGGGASFAIGGTGSWEYALLSALGSGAVMALVLGYCSVGAAVAWSFMHKPQVEPAVGDVEGTQ